MAREFARSFYNSSAWQICARRYAKSKGGLCEECLVKGIIKPYRIVHHKVKLTPDNIDDPGVTLNWDNLQAVCADCHAMIHTGRRWKVDASGEVTMRGA